MEREQVIKGMEVILKETTDMFYRSTLQDAIALLKAQEPVVPVRMNHTEDKYRDHYRCPICKEDLSYEQNYCPDCGRAMLWE